MTATLPLGAELRKLRTAHGWTQDQLSDKSGVSAHTILRIERGLVSPALSTLTLLLETLGYTIAFQLEEREERG